MSEGQVPGEPMPGVHTSEAQMEEELLPEGPMPEIQVEEEEKEEEKATETLMEEALMAALMSAEQMDEVLMEEAQTTEESTTEEVTTEEPVEEPIEDEPMEDVPMEDVLMEDVLMDEESTTEESMEDGSMEEELLEEALGTRRRRFRRPPRWQHSTATQSKLQRALHVYRLESQIEEYALNREEIQEFAPPETRRFLRGARSAPPMDAVTQEEDQANGEEQPDSAQMNALYVPQNRLQVARFNESIRMRDYYETATHAEMISITMPTAYETWKMEKEHSDLKAALNVSLRTVAEDDREKDHRRGMWSRSRENRTHLLRSRGYGSSFREVISADEDWPEEDWASAGLEQPDAPFLVRFEAKMRTRPVLVPDKTTETR